MYVAMAIIQLFSKILKTQISVVLQILPPDKNFLCCTRLCFERYYTLRNFFTANIQSVTVEISKNCFAQIWSLTLY